MKSYAVHSVSPGQCQPNPRTGIALGTRLMEHEKRVVYITSQTKTFHWLFNLLSANGEPMKVICFVFANNGDKYSTSCFCKLISIVHCKTEIAGRVEFITDLDHLNMSEEVVIRMNL